jgi:hypothetical protein
MIQVALAGYTIRLGESMPADDDTDCARAMLVERFGASMPAEQDSLSARNVLHIEVRRDAVWPMWPFLCITQRYHREGGGHPGVLLVPETGILFIGAGERLLAYDLRGPVRLWEDQADMGFHTWQRHGDWVLMSSELDLAAWDIRGVKRWSTFVEPPWSYQVDGNTVRLEVMGTPSSFSLESGPARS